MIVNFHDTRHIEIESATINNSPNVIDTAMRVLLYIDYLKRRNSISIFIIVHK